MKTNKFLFFLFFLFPFPLFSQLVNIENMRMHTDSVRVTGNMGFSFSYQENNAVSLMVLKSSLALQLKSKSLKDIFMCIGNIDLSKSSSQDFSNSAFGHFRYNRKLNKWLRWEAFTQMQYNRLLGVGLRWLNGTGPRFKLWKKENSTSYFGALYMYEYEETTGIIPVTNRNHRMSNYWTVSCAVPKIKGEFISTSYFQPRLDKLDDFRILNQTTFAFHITEKLKLTTSIVYLFDAFPPENVNSKAFSFDQGIRIDF